jgi:hypothetical protein
MRNSEQRKAERYTPPSSKQICEMRIGGIRVPAKLVNESATGFGVIIDHLMGLKKRQKVELKTPMGWVRTRVVYITEVDPEHRVTQDPTAHLECVYRIGLHQLKVLELHEISNATQPPSNPNNTVSKSPQQTTPNPRTSHKKGILFSVTVILIVATLSTWLTLQDPLHMATWLKQFCSPTAAPTK